MQIIRLPRDLTALDLTALNRQLRAGEIGLDWTEVDSDSVQMAQLTSLLAGLSLAEHIESIGADTIPEALQKQVLAALSRREEQDAREDGIGAADNGGRPALWLPENDIPDEDATRMRNIGPSGDDMLNDDFTEPRKIGLPANTLLDEEATTLGGRKRFLPDGGQRTHSALAGRTERSAKNHPIQGTNADILKRALALLHTSMPEGCHLVLTVHDEIVLEAPEQAVSEAELLLQRTMVQACREFLSVVAIPEPDVLVGDYWQKD